MHLKRAACCLLLGYAAAANASDAMHYPMPGARDWREVEDIEARVAAARVAPYQSHYARWMLAPDGRFALISAGSQEHGHPSTAMLGRFARNGAWLELSYEDSAIDLASMTPEARAELAAHEAEFAEAAAAHLAEADPAIATDVEAEADSTDEDDLASENDSSTRRFLIVPHRHGELLIEGDHLIDIATDWKGEGALQIAAYLVEAWRLTEGAPARDDYSFEFEIDAPLSAGLPAELARLLRPDAIEARVAEVLDTHESLRWKRQQTEVRLQLNRGEKDGLFVGMPLYGLAPNDEFRGKLIEVHADHALATVSLERFSPREQPNLPGAGMRFTTRTLKGGACSLDFSAAVRGKVQAVATAAADLDWSDDGYAWFELTLDQGAGQGLTPGDVLYPEDHAVEGEGRVLQVRDKSTIVLWRAMRYDESVAPQLPSIDTALVTPAWRRAEYDVFGSVPGLEKAAQSE
jgi:hypothetical protein